MLTLFTVHLSSVFSRNLFCLNVILKIDFNGQKTPFFNVLRPIFSLKPKHIDEMISTIISEIPINIEFFRFYHNIFIPFTTPPS